MNAAERGAWGRPPTAGVQSREGAAVAQGAQTPLNRDREVLPLQKGVLCVPHSWQIKGRVAAERYRSSRDGWGCSIVAVMARPQRRYTLDDYFTIEAMSEIKHEFHKGEIFAMAGASAAHNEITANVLARLRIALRRHGCRAYGSDFRVETPSGLFTYPDVSVFCAPLLFVRGRDDTVTNPVLLAEVLSEATRDYDRGDKFALYKSIPTLREYLLIEQSAVRVEQWVRSQSARWTLSVHERLDEAVRLAGVPVTLKVAEIYREVFPLRRTTALAQKRRGRRTQ